MNNHERVLGCFEKKVIQRNTFARKTSNNITSSVLLTSTDLDEQKGKTFIIYFFQVTANRNPYMQQTAGTYLHDSQFRYKI